MMYNEEIRVRQLMTRIWSFNYTNMVVNGANMVVNGANMVVNGANRIVY